MLFIHLGSAVYTVTETVFISVCTKLKTKDDKSKRQLVLNDFYSFFYTLGYSYVTVCCMFLLFSS